MIEGEESETALVAARLRAAHQVIDSAPRILDDPICVGLVPGSSEAELRAAAGLMATPFMQTLRTSFVLRSRIAEDALADAITTGASQYVLLGAGFDTFAYRPTSRLGRDPHTRPLRIFELDHPATQAAKRRYLEAAGHSLPTNLVLCPADFEHEGFSEALNGTGFDPSATTFYSWLGVVPYLTIDAVKETLREIRALSKDHSIALSFVLPDHELSGIDAETVRISATAAKNRGEAWLSRFTRSEMDELLESLGYRSIQHHGPNEFAALLTDDRRDDLRAPSFERVVVAR